MLFLKELILDLLGEFTEDLDGGEGGFVLGGPIPRGVLPVGGEGEVGDWLLFTVILKLRILGESADELYVVFVSLLHGCDNRNLPDWQGPPYKSSLVHG